MRITCTKCGKEMNEDQFYTHRDGTKAELCKKCLTMHIDNFDPSTFVWILEKFDIPYVPTVWEELRNKAFARNPNLNGTSVFGKYLSSMKLNQYKGCGWADSEELQKKAGALDEEKKEQQKELDEQYHQMLEKGEINESQYKTLTSASFQNLENQKKNIQASNTMSTEVIGKDNAFNEENFLSPEELGNPAAELTYEDKIALAIKWGRLYEPNDWIALEKNYNEMMNSFDIHDADTINTLKLLCKTNLKLNNAIDAGDFDGYQKLARVADSLRKSAKFTAVQNKDNDNEVVDSVGNLVAYCEEKGGAIPRFDFSVDLDIVDTVLKDLKSYNKSLIYEDSTLAQQIEGYIKRREILDMQKRNQEEAEKKGLDAPELTDEDYMEHLEYIEEQKKQDAQEMDDIE